MVDRTEFAAMRRAIALSAQGLGTTSPNPPVGCVVLDPSGRVVGEGFHVRKGEPHAEAHALRAAGPAARGGTAAVTLEPCNHHGRTPPCHQALLDAGVARVLIAVIDPTSRGEGGAARLKTAGVDVEVGVLEEEARFVLGPWLSCLAAKRPYVTWAYRVSPEGRVTEVFGRTGDLARGAGADAAALRASSDVVVAGDGQVEEAVPQAHGADVFRLSPDPVPSDPGCALAALSGAGVRIVLLTGAPEAVRPYLDAGAVDRIVVYLSDQGPSSVPAVADRALEAFNLPVAFRLTDVARLGGCVRLTAERVP